MTTPPLDSTGFLRWLWRQLTSMRTALILLFLLALASIPGSFFPQRGNDPIAVEGWITDAPTIGPILNAIGMFDVYAAPWFAAVYILLFISLIGCVLPRVGVHWREMRTPPPRTPRNLQRLPAFGTVETTDDSAAVLQLAREHLRGWKIRDDGNSISAEKGYLRETGNLVFHLALIALLIGVAVGALFGWRGNVIVREGSGFSNTLTQYDAWGGGRLASDQQLSPFRFTLDRFGVDFDRRPAQFGAPTFFEADVTLQREPNAQPESLRIEVNYPLTVDGVKVFLVGHGYAPRFTFVDGTGETVFDDAVVFLPQDGSFTSTGVLKLPDAQPPIGFQGLFLPTSALTEELGPHSIFPAADDPSVFFSAWTGDLGLDSGVPQSIYRLVTDDMTQLGLEAMRPGDSWDLPEGAGTITFTGFDRWASFQIAFDPGKELTLAAAVIAMIGLMASLFIRRRRLWVRATTNDVGVTVVEVGALGRSDSVDVTDDVSSMVQALEEGR
jgi:cytochrome c biogenesis protein